MSFAGHPAKPVSGLLALVFSGAILAQQTVEVRIQDYKFIPAEVRIKVGDTVKWINMEKRTSHSVLFPAENGLESERMFPGEHWSRTFTAQGSHAYRCGPHEEMKGMVHVD
jgi:plastocyanin